MKHLINFLVAAAFLLVVAAVGITVVESVTSRWANIPLTVDAGERNREQDRLREARHLQAQKDQLVCLEIAFEAAKLYLEVPDPMVAAETAAQINLLRALSSRGVISGRWALPPEWYFQKFERATEQAMTLAPTREGRTVAQNRLAVIKQEWQRFLQLADDGG